MQAALRYFFIFDKALNAVISVVAVLALAVAACLGFLQVLSPLRFRSSGPK